MIMNNRRVKKYVYLMRSFFVTVRNEGLVRSVRRMYYFVRYGKGVASHEEYRAYRTHYKIPVQVASVHALVRYAPDDEAAPHTYDGAPIDIIIPVYNGYDYLAPLFESVMAHTDMPFRAIVIDDASPDERVAPFLAQLSEQYPSADIVVHRNEHNRGFIQTVNAGMAMAQSHCVLLNTDVEVPQGWLSRLMRPIIDDATVASATPFTNAGETFSFPVSLKNNALPCGMTVGDVDRFFRRLVPQQWPTVPTGMGFCMALNKVAIDRIGMFDAETFGRGYAEENDWCRRAVAVGLRNVIVPNLFIYHKHGGSFLPKDKQELLAHNLRVLNTRYPGYDAMIQKFIRADVMRGVRELVMLWIAAARCAKKVVLYFDHELGGGANMYVRQRVKEVVADGGMAIVVSYNLTHHVYHGKYFFAGYRGNFESPHVEDILALIQHVPIHHVVVSQMVSYPAPLTLLPRIMRVIDDTKAASTFLVHDFFALCPSFNLLNDKGVYCGVPRDLAVCKRCLMRQKGDFRIYCDEKDIVAWRAAWGAFLERIDDIVCFSQSSHDVVLRAYPQIASKIVVRPHQVDYITRTPHIAPKKAGKKIVIGVLGGINYQKGSEIVAQMLATIEQRKLPMQIVVIGPLAQKIHSPFLTVHGPFKTDEIVSLTEKYRVDVFAIPSIWPETFSYTAEEIMQMKMPLMVFDIGAPAERAAQYDGAMIVMERTGAAMVERVRETFLS